MSRIAVSELLRKRLVRLVRTRDGDAPDYTAVFKEVDDAPVGQARDGELRNCGERVLVVERRRQDSARVREEGKLGAAGVELCRGRIDARGACGRIQHALPSHASGIVESLRPASKGASNAEESNMRRPRQ